MAERVLEKLDILDYIAEASVYEVLEHKDKRYILVHAGLGGFSPDKKLDEYELYELFEERADYSKRYYPDENTYLVTGHTPTFYIQGWNKPEVYRQNGHIAIDCGCVGGGKLAAFCIFIFIYIFCPIQSISHFFNRKSTTYFLRVHGSVRFRALQLQHCRGTDSWFPQLLLPMPGYLPIHYSSILRESSKSQRLHSHH